MKVLMVLTSHSRLGDTGKKTGFWVEEFAAPYYIFKDANAEITLASPKGGQPPLDPKSDAPDAQTEATERFKQDEAAQAQLANTLELADVVAEDLDAYPRDFAHDEALCTKEGVDVVFYPGGHGPLWDLTVDSHSIALIESMYAAGKTVAAVCHAPAVLRDTTAPDGKPLVQGKSVTGFSNTEEEAVQLTEVVPFLLEDELKAKGANYSKAENWHVYVCKDGNLITGQNPASSEAVAEAVLEKFT